LQVEANFRLGQAYCMLSDYAPATALLRENLRLLAGDAAGQHTGLGGLTYCGSCYWLVPCLTQRGEFGGARAGSEEALRVAEATDHPYTLVAPYLALGSLWLMQGAFQPAIGVLKRVEVLCETWQLRYFVPRIASALGYAYLLSGQAADGMPLLE